MSNKNNNGAVRVTAEEREHPSLRLLARACIALAHLRLERRTEIGGQAQQGEAVQTANQEPEDQDA